MRENDKKERRKKQKTTPNKQKQTQIAEIGELNAINASQEARTAENKNRRGEKKTKPESKKLGFQSDVRRRRLQPGLASSKAPSLAGGKQGLPESRNDKLGIMLASLGQSRQAPGLAVNQPPATPRP